MKRLRRYRAALVFLPLAMVELLGRMLADDQRLAELLSPGAHMSLTTLALGVVFVVLRLVAIVLIPGLAAAGLTLAAFRQLRKLAEVGHEPPGEPQREAE